MPVDLLDDISDTQSGSLGWRRRHHLNDLDAPVTGSQHGIAQIAGRYAQERPLSRSASLVFEQSYGGVEGDSASLAELCALLSAIGDVPLRQDIAITGSVDQHGQVQAVGGVNEKVEGFFDVCRERGLDGSHGVIIPQDNVKHLMLREDVVAAVRDGKFSIFGVQDVDEAIGVLTGVDATVVNQKVEEQLVRYATLRKEFGEKGEGGEQG